jgi:hypothetical protein
MTSTARRKPSLRFSSTASGPRDSRADATDLGLEDLVMAGSSS